MNLEERIRSLSSHSGVPVAFECVYACSVENGHRVETHLHDAFGDHRVNPKREFFRINPERVIAVLKLVELSDVTPSDDIVEDKEDQDILDRERERRSIFKFSLVKLAPGDIIKFVRDEDITARVFDDRQIDFEGEVTSLNQATLKVLSRDFGKSWKSVQGPQYWTYEGEALTERRLQLESED